MQVVVSTLATLGSFPFRSAAGVLVAGKVNADFTKRVIKDGVVSAVVATVSEITSLSGYYSTSLTPTSTGSWTVIIEYTANPTFAWSESFDVLPAAADPAAIADAIAGVAAMTDVATSTRASAAVWTSGRAERLDRIGADSVAVRSATAASELIELRQGADYTVSADTALEWDVTTLTDLSPVGTVVTLTISSRSLQGDGAITATCAVTNPAAATKTITAELTDTDTGRLRTSEFTRYQIDAQIGTDTVPLVDGRVKVLPVLT